MNIFKSLPPLLNGCIVASIIGTLGLTGCSTSTQGTSSVQVTNPKNSNSIAIDGSSTVYPITMAVTKEFRQSSAADHVQVDVKFSGTTAGFRKFCGNEIDISNASRPILTEEKDACVRAGVAFIELPIAFDALTIVVNPQNTWANDITVEDLKKAWAKSSEGKITSWNQIRASYPNLPLNLFGPGADSGTFDYFNEAILGDRKGSRADYVSSEDDTVLVQGISQSTHALGYIPHAYYEQNQGKVKALPLNSGKGATLPTTENVQLVKYQPLSRPLFIYVNAKTAQDNPNLRAFVEFYLKQARNLVTSVGYVPLPAEGYRLAEIQFTRGEVGTAFKGKPEPSVTISEVLRRQVDFQESQQANNSQ